MSLPPLLCQSNAVDFNILLRLQPVEKFVRRRGVINRTISNCVLLLLPQLNSCNFNLDIRGQRHSSQLMDIKEAWRKLSGIMISALALRKEKGTTTISSMCTEYWRWFKKDEQMSTVIYHYGKRGAGGGHSNQSLSSFVFQEEAAAAPRPSSPIPTRDCWSGKLNSVESCEWEREGCLNGRKEEGIRVVTGAQREWEPWLRFIETEG